MKYILMTIIFFTNFGYAKDVFNSKEEALSGFCLFDKKQSSPGFLMALEDGKVMLRCTVVRITENQYRLAWVEINTKNISSNLLTIKEEK